MRTAAVRAGLRDLLAVAGGSLPRPAAPLKTASLRRIHTSPVAAHAGGAPRYPRFTATDRMAIRAFRNTYGGLKHEDGPAETVVCVAGRVVSRREMSRKLVFVDVQSDGERLQIVSSRGRFADDGAFAAVSAIRRGDVVMFRGRPGRTPAGELSLLAHEGAVLAPCLSNLPEVLEDPEVRFRARHLDLVLNPHVLRNMLVRRSVISCVRAFLDARGFVEVDTPVLWPTAGGANARPFTTYSRAFGKTPLTLRVSPELFLKQLVVGGMERVYEIGRQFRNEGIDPTHNPEFTTCEYYEAYADFESLVSNTENLLATIATRVTGSTSVPAGARTIDFTPPFPRVSLAAELEKILGLAPSEQHGHVLRGALAGAITRLGLPPAKAPTTAAMLDRVVGDVVEPMLAVHDRPVFLTDYPVVLSPLAKSHEETPNITARFELFVDGRELCNAYVELNDPAEQRRRFAQQQQDRNAGDDEAQVPDEAFCQALEYGLPPTAGWGLGIDRLVMLLAGARSIREVLAFPCMRPVGIIDGGQ